MGYFKTLLIDPSAARDYHRRWERLAQNDQAGACVEDSRLVIDHRGQPMIVATIAQPVNITRGAVGRALNHWRAQVQHSPRDLTALNRAALNIEACPWTPNGDELVITSATNSHRRYHVTANGCDCRAAASGVVCWHR